ncbi:MAG: hypothetical protein ACOX78_06730 [Lachnospiraceae bacterium]|jgi:2-dehydropantoate 2-reductase
MKYTIKDITEADYGCEELPDGACVMCRLVLEAENGMEVVKEVPDEKAAAAGLAAGQRISDGEIEALCR